MEIAGFDARTFRDARFARLVIRLSKISDATAKSVLQARKARFGQGWAQASSGQWLALTRARFGADNNTQLNINAGIDTTVRVENRVGVAKSEWFLQTGGVVKQTPAAGQRAGNGAA